jgi:hypothetical protein
MLADLAGSVAGPAGLPITVATASFDLPVEVSLRWGAGGGGGDVEFLADVPRWRWETAFDPRPGRLRMLLEAVPGQGGQP